jgi:hypothetical protein
LQPLLELVQEVIVRPAAMSSTRINTLAFIFLWYLKLNNTNSAVKRGYCLDWPFLKDAENENFERIAEKNSKKQQIIYLCNPASKLKLIFMGFFC